MMSHSKSILCLLAAALLLAAVSCSRQKSFDRILAEADTVVEQQPDSALRLLGHIIGHEAALSSAQRAMYHLLLTQSKYRLFQDRPDSLLPLIAASETYYQTTHDLSLYCRSKYYHAMMLNELKRHSEAIEKLMEGSKMAEQIGDTLQMAKYYESIDAVYASSQNYQLAIQASKQLLNLSVMMNDKERVVRATALLASHFTKLGQRDSALYYTNQIIAKFANAKNEDKVWMLSNIGCVFLNNGDTLAAKKYLMESLKIDTLYNACAALASISMYENRMSDADSLWEWALKTPKAELRLNMMNLRIKSYLEVVDRQGKLKRWFDDVLALDDSLRIDSESKMIAEFQFKYDQESLKSRHRMIFIYLLLLIIALIVVAAVLFLYNLYNVKSYDSELRKQKSQITALEEQSEISEKEKQKLVQSMKAQNESTYYKLGRGKAIYESILDGGNFHTISPEDEECFIDYYSVLKYDSFDQWLSNYKKISKRQLIYLILVDMGYDDEKISEFLCVSKAAIRMTKMRLRNQIKQFYI